LETAVVHKIIYSVQNIFPNIVNQSSSNLKSPLTCCTIEISCIQYVFTFRTLYQKHSAFKRLTPHCLSG